MSSCPCVCNHIKELHITHFRNLQRFDLPRCAQVNVFYGKNGSGKTSILESIYYLSNFKSFRTSAYQRLLQYGQASFSIVIKLQHDRQLISMGVERDDHGGKHIRINAEKASSVAELAKQLPVIMIDPHSYRFFHDGPKVRRAFMDFGLFHVEHDFYKVWKQYHYVLKQRNACLKQRLGKHEVDAWTHEFCQLAERMHQMRKQYIEKFQQQFLVLVNELLPDYEDVSLHYDPGWNETDVFAEQLQRHYFSDVKVGFTQLGPHRADCQLYYNQTIAAQDVFSQGQQKLASYALYLTQGLLLQQLKQISPIYLIDDLPSELDSEKNKQIVEILKHIQAQIFVTGVEQNDLLNWCDSDDVQMFHVERGELAQAGTAEAESAEAESAECVAQQ